MREKSVTTRTVTTAGGVFAPGHLDELTQIVDFALVDAVLEETGAREKRLRLLPARVVVYFTLALALFEHGSYRIVWGTLTAALGPLASYRPAASSPVRARRRLGVAPLRRLFETLASPVARPGQASSFYRGLRTVAVDGTHLHVPDEPQITWRYPKRAGETLEFGYPLLRLVAIVECGTRAVLAACFGPESDGELAYTRRLLDCLDRSMLLLADAGHWAALELPTVAEFDYQGEVPVRRRWALARRSLSKPEEIAYFLAYAPRDTVVGDLVRVAGMRWQIEECLCATRRSAVSPAQLGGIGGRFLGRVRCMIGSVWNIGLVRSWGGAPRSGRRTNTVQARSQ